MGVSDRDGTTVDVLAEAVIARVVAARLSLGEAVATADSRAVARALDELEESLSMARESGVTVPRALEGPVDR
jgi:hypothetical protein